MRTFFTIFLRGLFAVLPLFVTIYLFVWFGLLLETVFGSTLKWALPEDWYLPGMGVVVGIAFIYGMGLTLQSWFLSRAWEWFEAWLERIPLVKEIYRSLRQMVEYLTGGAGADAQQAVTVGIGDGSVRLLGLVTRDDLSEAPEGLAGEEGEETVAVYLPMSYQIGGFTVYLPKSQTRPVKMDTKEALQWTFTGGVSDDKDSDESEGEGDSNGNEQERDSGGSEQEERKAE